MQRHAYLLMEGLRVGEKDFLFISRQVREGFRERCGELDIFSEVSRENGTSV